MNVLVTGGAGYVGSHVAVELLAAGHDVTVLDDLSNSRPETLAAVRRVAHREIGFREGDIRDGALLDALFEDAEFHAVAHFAARKAVAESVADPLRYYDNNVLGTARLLERMAHHGVKTIVFSSSATVYGEPRTMPITEDCPTDPVNPYGRSKLMGEQMLQDVRAADPEWRVSILRYFNPIGAHPSGELGECPVGAPENLVPFIAQVATGKRERLEVFGNDYPTPDGTCIRDYIHVVDLARAHVKALDFLAAGPRLAVHNLGTGRGYSVLEVVRAFEQACGRSLPRRFAPRRPGDIPVSYASPARAKADLDWAARHDLPRMCEDHWRWQSRDGRRRAARSSATTGGYGARRLKEV